MKKKKNYKGGGGGAFYTSPPLPRPDLICPCPPPPAVYINMTIWDFWILPIILRLRSRDSCRPKFRQNFSIKTFDVIFLLEDLPNRQMKLD